MPQRERLVRLDDLATGKLPPRVISAISKVELTVAEMTEWEESRPTFRLMVKDGILAVDLRVRVPWKKTVAIVGGIASILLAGTKLLLEFLPALISFLNLKLPTP